MATISTKKLNSAKYPLEVTYTSGATVKRFKVPNQYAFAKGSFLEKHGCSIMAEHTALQWLGVTKYSPSKLLELHRAKTPECIAAKVTLRGVAKLMKDLVPKAKVKYSAVNGGDIIRQLRYPNRAMVLFEEGGPIHTVALLKAEGKYWRITNGKCERIDIHKELLRATKNKKYSGAVYVGFKK